MRHTVGTLDFFFFNSLPLLLFATVFGVTSITGVLIGGLVYGLIGYASTTWQNIAFVVLFVGIRLLVGNPNGLVGLLFEHSRRLLGWRFRTRQPREAPPPGAEPYGASGRTLEAPLGAA
jgi:hypothetical protein